MSETATSLLAIYVDGETKTGKGAAGAAIAESLEQNGYSVHYDVAGNFYRRYVALARSELGLQDDNELVAGPELERVAQQLYDSRKAFSREGDFGDLQRPIISRSVPLLGELAVAQRAGMEWFADALRQSLREQVDVMVLDGRNPRQRIADQLRLQPAAVTTALDLFMTCDPKEAARRNLLSQGVLKPTDQQLVVETRSVVERRLRDRTRKECPFQQPLVSIAFDPESSDPLETVTLSHESAPSQGEAPLTIKLDNTKSPKPIMLQAATELSLVAVRFLTEDIAAVG